jgi:hypothetical protein
VEKTADSSISMTDTFVKLTPNVPDP